MFNIGESPCFLPENSDIPKIDGLKKEKNLKEIKTTN